MSGTPILTVAEMADAERAVIEAGTSVETLMERAGRAVADIAWRVAGRERTLVLCGPGNNGGDGYVVARLLAERGCDVTVGALAEPGSDAALQARERYQGAIVPVAEAKSAPLVIDALFGTGLSRPLGDDLAALVARHVEAARHGVAVDLPSGVDTDSGALLSPVPDFDVTVALGALKPAHLLRPAADHVGQVLIGEIGIDAESALTRLMPPRLSPPQPGEHKYSRGYVIVAAGEMGGAAALTAQAAMRAGAGYVALAGQAATAAPHALVHRAAADGTALAKLLEDERIDVLAIGPGLGTGEAATDKLRAALDSAADCVFDADAINLLAEDGPDRLRTRGGRSILTPHEGEFERLFGKAGGSKVDRAREAAARSGSVVVVKGNDTVIAAPDGRAVIGDRAPSWLASAGTGDVLTGIVAARLAQTGDCFRATCEAVWLHGEAARRAGPFLIADDLVARLPGTLAGRLAR